MKRIKPADRIRYGTRLAQPAQSGGRRATQRKISVRDRLRYRFDTYMSKGAIALIGLLAAVTAVFVVIAGLAYWISGVAQPDDQPLKLGEGLWVGLMRSLDAGNVGGDTGWDFRLVSLIVTIGGIFITSALIGVIFTGINGRLEELRKGRSLVAEQGHTVILGWSPRVFSVVSELVVANESQRRAAIALLAPRDKVVMEDELHAHVRNFGHTSLVCRTGDPNDLRDLAVVNLHGAKSIIVAEPEAGDADLSVIKTILAIINDPTRRAEPYHIVAAIRERKSLEVARMVGGAEVELLMLDEVIARITAQTCRQSGLSEVYTEILSFDGDEIYFHNEPRLTGKSFGETLLAFSNAAVIGLRTADGHARLNPPLDTVLQAGDSIIAIAEDDDTFRLAEPTSIRIDEAAIRSAAGTPRAPERSLILGWNRRGPTVVTQLDQYVAAGSVVKVVADIDLDDKKLERICAYENSSLSFERGDITDRATLDALQVGDYDHVITLSYLDKLDPQAADGITLMTLLHLRDIAQRSGRTFPIVSEMLDVRNRDLASVTRADDFIVSDQLVSLLMSQVSENHELAEILDDLFDPEGSELYLKPAAGYVALDTPVSFYTIVEAARRRGELAIGYRLKAAAEVGVRGLGVVLNPEKSETVVLREDDRIIVVAES